MVEGDSREKKLSLVPRSTMTYSMYALNLSETCFRHLQHGDNIYLADSW